MELSTGIAAVTLVVRDLTAARAFYADALGAEQVFEDPQSVVFRFGGTMVNLLQEEAAPELVEPATVAPYDMGVRAVYTVAVTDADAVAAVLQERGVPLLNGPVTRPWGPRTVSVRDPDGHVWEFAAS